MDRLLLKLNRERIEPIELTPVSESVNIVVNAGEGIGSGFGGFTSSGGADPTFVCHDRFARALVLDDDDHLRRSLARLLRSWRCEVFEATTVAEGKRLLFEQSPDLIVTDVRLPDGSGCSLAEAAKRCSPLPLMAAMSGLASASEAFSLAQSGVRLYLTKPFAQRELVQGLADILSDVDRERMEATGTGVLDEESGLELFAKLYNITHREMALVRLAMNGVPRARCPGLLNVSENTCKTMTRRLLQRCGARNLADIPRIVLTCDPTSAKHQRS